MTTTLDIIKLRAAIIAWFPTAVYVNLSYGQTYLRVQVCHNNGTLLPERRIAWDDLLQADNPEEVLKTLLTKAGSGVKRD